MWWDPRSWQTSWGLLSVGLKRKSAGPQFRPGSEAAASARPWIIGWSQRRRGNKSTMSRGEGRDSITGCKWNSEGPCYGTLRAVTRWDVLTIRRWTGGTSAGGRGTWRRTLGGRSEPWPCSTDARSPPRGTRSGSLRPRARGTSLRCGKRPGRTGPAAGRTRTGHLGRKRETISVFGRSAAWLLHFCAAVIQQCQIVREHVFNQSSVIFAITTKQGTVSFMKRRQVHERWTLQRKRSNQKGTRSH